MLTFTKPGDTAQSIANRVLGHYDANYAKEIWRYNVHSLACELTNRRGEYAPFRALWLPQHSVIDDDPAMCERIVHKTEFIHSAGRRNLALLESSGVDIAQMLGSCKAFGIQNMTEQDYDQTAEYSEEKSVFESAGFKIPFEVASRVTERLYEPAEKFIEKLTRLNELGKNFIKADGLTEKQSLLDEMKLAYKDAMEAWNGEARMYTRLANMKTRRYVKSVKNIQRRMFRGGVWISDLEDVRILSKIANYGRFITKGFTYLNVIIDGGEVFKTYLDGGDYMKKAVGLAAELITIEFIGAALMVFMPEFLLATVAVGAIEGISFFVAGEQIEKGSEKIYAKAFE